MATWESCKLSMPVRKTLDDFGFVSMTPVQAACIPVFLKNKDVVVEAVTGSGKTLAFLIPVIEMLLKKEHVVNHQVLALVISPTRELAFQIWQVLDRFIGSIRAFSHCLLVGGNPIEDDLQKLKMSGCNIIVATPGRMEDLLIRNELSTGIKHLEILILDEADRLLDLGFQNSINNILQFLPKQRRTGLFSATMTKELQSLIRAGLRNPVAVFVKEKSSSSCSTPHLLENYYAIVGADRKLSSLVTFVRKQGQDKKYIIFFPTCASVEWFYTVLKNHEPSFEIYSLHGKMGSHRRRTLEKFKSAESGLLLSTDVLARGIDVPEVHWVIQYDPPKNPESFVHRVGRTARNGRSGSSCVFLLPTEEVYVDFIRMNQKVELSRWDDLDDENDFGPVYQTMRNLQFDDRANLDRANRAFVSYIQFYSKHECSLIFKVDDLDYGRLATGFGLLRLPRMPELRGKRIEFFAATEIDIGRIKYKNLEQERARIRKMTSKIQEDKTKEKKRIDRCRIKRKKKKKKPNWDDQDLESLRKDVALISKLRKKKISQESFEKQFCNF